MEFNSGPPRLTEIPSGNDQALWPRLPLDGIMKLMLHFKHELLSCLNSEDFNCRNFSWFYI